MEISEQERLLRQSMAQDMGRLFGRIIFTMTPWLFFVLVYGVFNLIRKGDTPTNYWHTYVPLVGSVISLVCCGIYPMAMFYNRGGLGACMAFTGFIPYLFALFVMLVLGGGRFHGLLSQFSVIGLLIGVFWLGVGYAILSNFWILTEAVSSAEKARARVLGSLKV